MKIPLIVVAGPTASGKSALALELCERYGGELVSADSMQIYRGLDIGTAKPTAEEQKRARHHMIDILDINEKFSAADYAAMAGKIIADIHKRGRLPVIAGGTGLYIDSVISGMEFSHSGENVKLRNSLARLAEEEGAEALHGILRQKDPVAAEKIHPNNVKRVIRALEIIDATGKSIDESVKKPGGRDEKYNCLYIVISRDRDKLYERINLRVDEMVKAGIYEEAKWLFENVKDKSATAMQAIGYKEFIPVYEGQGELGEAIEILKRNTRRYAKRQITWFSRHKDALFLSDPTADILEKEERFKDFLKCLGE